jgi:hypothetical protein
MAIATTAEKNSLATKYGTDAAFAALFTADPGTSGTVVGEVTGGSPAYARKAITWGAPSGGVITATVTFDVPASTTVTFAGVCSASTGANLLDRVAVTSQTFAAQGTYALTLTFTEN